MTRFRLTKIAQSLPATVPFVGPETQERARGMRFDARLGANESVFGPSPSAVRAMAETPQWMYGDPENHDLRHALAQHLDTPVETIMVGEGIDGLLGHLVRLVRSDCVFSLTMVTNCVDPLAERDDRGVDLRAALVLLRHRMAALFGKLDAHGMGITGFDGCGFGHFECQHQTVCEPPQHCGLGAQHHRMQDHAPYIRAIREASERICKVHDGLMKHDGRRCDRYGAPAAPQRDDREAAKNAM